MYDNDIKFIKNMSFDDVDAIRKRLEKKREWPRDMRGSIRPKLVVISPNPGSSSSAGQEYKKDTNPPWIRCVNGFFYEDRDGYWDEFRNLCKLFFNRKVDGGLNPDLLLLVTHFNLYSDNNECFIDFIVDYLSDESINPDLIILNGLKKYIRNDKDSIKSKLSINDEDKNSSTYFYRHGMRQKEMPFWLYKKNQKRKTPIVVLSNSITRPEVMHSDDFKKVFLKICRDFLN